MIHQKIKEWITLMMLLILGSSILAAQVVKPCLATYTEDAYVVSSTGAGDRPNLIKGEPDNRSVLVNANEEIIVSFANPFSRETSPTIEFTAMHSGDVHKGFKIFLSEDGVTYTEIPTGADGFNKPWTNNTLRTGELVIPDTFNGKAYKYIKMIPITKMGFDSVKIKSYFCGVYKGNVFNDSGFGTGGVYADNIKNGTESALGLPYSKLFVNFYNIHRELVASVPVDENGSYYMPQSPDGNYLAVLSTDRDSIQSTLPTLWTNSTFNGTLALNISQQELTGKVLPQFGIHSCQYGLVNTGKSYGIASTGATGWGGKADGATGAPDGDAYNVYNSGTTYQTVITYDKAFSAGAKLTITAKLKAGYEKGFVLAFSENGVTYTNNSVELIEGLNTTDFNDIEYIVPDGLNGDYKYIRVQGVDGNSLLLIDAIAIDNAQCATCSAGGTAPILSQSKTTLDCTHTAADLTGITASNQLNGTTLTWHTTFSATPNSEIHDVSSLPPGIYFAAFKGTNPDGSVCYSGVSNDATTQYVVERPKDSDCDGVPDSIDLDDDNDGILDTDEFISCNENIKNLEFVGAAVTNQTSDSLTTAYSANWVSSYTSKRFELPIHLEYKINNTSTAYAMIGLVGTTKSKTYNNWNDEGNKFYHNLGNAQGYFNKKVWAIAATAEHDGDKFTIDIDEHGYVKAYMNDVLRYEYQGEVTRYQMVVSAYRPGVYTDIVLSAKNTMSINGVACGNDIDGDGILNQYDLDSDNDGIPDTIEGRPTAGYTPFNGIVDANGLGLIYGIGILPIDTDHDGIPDYFDSDSDNDGVSDKEESYLNPAGDVGRNGLYNNVETDDSYKDVDGDAYENNMFIIPDWDTDGERDYRDTSVRPPSQCGNNKLEFGEGCDDGNTANGDGCSATCKIEEGKQCNQDTDGIVGDRSCVSNYCNTYSNTCEIEGSDSSDAPNGNGFNFGTAQHQLRTDVKVFIGSVVADAEDTNQTLKWSSDFNAMLASKGDVNYDTYAKLTADELATVNSNLGDSNDENTITGPLEWIEGKKCKGLLPNGQVGEVIMTETTFCTTVKATNESNISAQLVGWIDFNTDGSFDKTAERSDVGVAGNVPAGTDNQDVVLVWNNKTKGTDAVNSYMRLRITTDSKAKNSDTLLATDTLADGEVEDYAIRLAPIERMVSPVVIKIDTKDVNESDPTKVLTSNNRPEINGTCQAGAIVTVQMNGGAIEPTTVCTNEGTFSMIPTNPIGDGEHNVTAIQTDPNTGVLSEISPVDYLTVDTTAPNPLTIETVDGKTGSPVTTKETTPEINGTCALDDNGTVTVQIDGVDIAPTTTCVDSGNRQGVYSVIPNTPLSAGEHNVTATETDAAGNTATTNVVKLIVESTLPDYDVALTLDKTTFINDADTFFATVRVTELLGGVNSGDVIYSINKNSKMTLKFDNTLSVSPDGTALSNSDWELTETASAYQFKYIGNAKKFTPSNRVRFGMSGVFTPPSSAKGKFIFKVKLRSGSGDTLNTNNEDSDAISYSNVN